MVIKFIRENRLIFLLYIFSTVFFIYQHSLGISWDFASYTLNAEYLFAGGNYFEWYRAPLAGFLIGLFTFFILPFRLAEYIYILFVSTLFLYSCLKFCRTFNLKPKLLYSLLLNPYLILVGLSVGTELLSLSFLILFLSYLFSEDKYNLKSGISFALASLARYSCFPYFILIFPKIRKNILSIIYFFIIIFLTFLPWFLFNYFATGHFLTSIANSHALNVKYRVDYLFQQPSLLHFLIVGNFLWIFFILGLRKSKINKKNIVVLVFLAITLISYISIPLKDPRYLFNILLPLSYFSYQFLKKIKNAELLFSFFSISIISLLVTLSIFGYSVNYLNFPKKEFYNIDLPKNCTYMSNHWVPLNYLGYAVEPQPRKEEVDHYIYEGYKIIIYYSGDIDQKINLTFLKSYPVLKETKYYIILGVPLSCKPVYKIDSPYLNKLNKTSTYIYNKTIETNPCKSLDFGNLCNYLKFL